jgi:hypothetical protein
VRVIPSAAILNCFPGVRNGLSRGGRALRDAGNAIILIGVVLADAMEMEARSVVRETVGNSYFDGIALE